MSKGYRGFTSKADYEMHYSDFKNYAAEIPAMEAYTRETYLERVAHLLVLKMSKNRYHVLSLIKDGKRLMWSPDWGGEPSAWWVEGAPNEHLHHATCHWLVRTKMASYDVQFNEDRDERGIGYRITEKGIANLTAFAPKAKVLKFKPRTARSGADVGKSGSQT